MKIPKQIATRGYMNYNFDKDGNFHTEAILVNEIVFSCVAKSEKEAKEKFTKYEKTKL